MVYPQVALLSHFAEGKQAPGDKEPVGHRAESRPCPVMSLGPRSLQSFLLLLHRGPSDERVRGHSALPDGQGHGGDRVAQACGQNLQGCASLGGADLTRRA